MSIMTREELQVLWSDYAKKRGKNGVDSAGMIRLVEAAARQQMAEECAVLCDKRAQECERTYYMLDHGGDWACYQSEAKHNAAAIRAHALKEKG